MDTIPTNRGPMLPQAIVDHLTYVNYAHNRDAAPHITPEQWASVYPNNEAMEARYQAEKAIRKAANRR